MSQNGGFSRQRKRGGLGVIRIVAAAWREVSPDVYEPVTGRSLATHVLEDDGAGTYEMISLGASVSAARMLQRGDIYLIYGV